MNVSVLFFIAGICFLCVACEPRSAAKFEKRPTFENPISIYLWSDTFPEETIQYVVDRFIDSETTLDLPLIAVELSRRDRPGEILRAVAEAGTVQKGDVVCLKEWEILRSDSQLDRDSFLFAAACP